MAKQYSIAAARDQLARLVHDAEEGQPVELTRRGKPVAILLAIEDYRRLQKHPVSFSAAVEELRLEVGFGVEPEEWLPARDPAGDYAHFNSLQILDPLEA
ncbi:MAG: type II toxin-antitoxin system Phd/YefM family antitoxin [Candidatus Eremiobacteraeota bacterium]|nr:type II toxin-antitoxin system Phd/YefM family antitoxin [Candidatus Eremiobacteraeota bacterium]MCW5867249.1 type II toxin-antitoxin system Phd/YefM family antitoxin [Candidatus Eremiobacteraeota bacterium]